MIWSPTPSPHWPGSQSRAGKDTHIDHGVGRDAEERGTLVDLLDLLIALSRELQGLQLAERALQRCPVLGNQVIASAEVFHFTGEGA